jgi:PAS domain S-box-containing protein
MKPDQIPYLIPYAVSVMMSLGIAWYAWRHRNMSGALMYSCVTTARALTTIAYILEISSDVLAVKVFWDDVQWATLSAVALSLVLFALYFAERPPAHPYRLGALLSVFPVLFLGLSATNRWHSLTRAHAVLIPGSPFFALYYDFTFLDYLFSVYLLALGLLVLALLIRRFFTVGALYRGQLATVITGIAISTFGGLLVILGVTLSFQRDILPLTFAISDVIVAWGLFRYRLFEVAPIAREKVIENMTDAVIVLDAQNLIVDTNPAARRLLERFQPDGKIIGQHVRDLFSPWVEVADQYIHVTGPVETEVTIQPRAGGPLTFTLSISPIWVRKSLLGGRVVVLKNITERKQIEQELRQRTRELEAARVMAEDANRTKTQFLANVSHELRTPLNAVINFNQFVASGLYGPVNSAQVDALEKSTGSARHLLSIINDVLDISKIEAGRLELYIEEDVDLLEELEAVAATVRTLLKEKPVELVLEFAGDLPHIAVDRLRLRQVLLNIASNAAKFTEKGFVKLRAWHTDGRVLFAVEDSGPGIPADQQELVFAPFRQLDHTRSPQEGTGLGLPISRRLVKALGGALWFQSEAGQGSTFFISLPREEKP